MPTRPVRKTPRLRATTHRFRREKLSVCLLLALGWSYCILEDGSTATTSVGSGLQVCGNSVVLDSGPAAPPEGAVAVPAGDNSSVDFTRPGATYWFAPGVHTLGDGRYDQIIPGEGSSYVGAPDAVLDGRRTNRYAFGGSAAGVTIEHLTVQNFGPSGTNRNEGVVNHDAAEDWTVRYSTIQDNAGAGLMIGSGNLVAYNCLTSNEQYGFNAYSSRGVSDIRVLHNEISHNNTYDWEAKVEGCGCTGGGKFWSVDQASVVGNYVHDNKGVGLWADTNNRGFLFERNRVSDNDDVGIFYETSYNAVIRDNVLVRNGLVAGPRNPGFPTGAIYLSESGADPRVPGRYAERLEITGNLLRDNWSGVVLWENADRYCGSPANTSTGDCTLVDPARVSAATCTRATIDRKPYYSDCRWKTQNVSVHDNTFEHDPGKVGKACSSSAHSCGLNAIASNYGTWPPWSPYQGTVVQRAIVHRQHNVFRDNTYRGPWRFMVGGQDDLRSFSEWQGAPYHQDAGSTLEPLPSLTERATPSARPSDGAAAMPGVIGRWGQ